MDLLLVEDNVSIIKGLEYSFKSNNINYKSVTNLKDLDDLLSKCTPKLILLDINLPDGDGLEYFIDKINKLNIPTIFLTAKSSEDDIVKGLELGAYDYITKPFSTRELLARVNRILINNNIVKVKDISFNFNKMEVYKNNKIISFTSLELKILYLLFTNLNKVVSRDSLIEYIWNLTGNDVNDNTITVYLKRIREKLDSDIIVTVKGIGYRIDEEQS